MPLGVAQPTTTLSRRDITYNSWIGSEVAADVIAILAAREQVKESVWTLCDLPLNWDSYGGQPLNRDVAALAEHLLVQLMAQDVALPAVVPMSTGGISLEWHRPSVRLILEIGPGTQPSAYYFDRASGDEWELEFPEASRPFGTALRTVSEAS